MAAASQKTDVTVPTTLSSATSKLVYLALRQSGTATVSELSERLNMQKLTLYSVLDTLAGKDLVDVDGERYTCTTST